MAFSGGTLEKADFEPGRAGVRAVGAEGDWGGTVLHNRWARTMQSECHNRERTDSGTAAGAGP